MEGIADEAIAAIEAEGYVMGDAIDVAVAVTEEPQFGNSKPPKRTPYCRFYGIVNGTRSQLTIWSHKNLAFIPPQGLHVGSIVYGQIEQKDTYNGTPTYWFSDVQRVETGTGAPMPAQAPTGPAGTPPVPAVAAGAPAPEYFTSTVMDFRQSLKFIDVTMRQVAKISRELFPSATDDSHLEAAQAVAVSFYIAVGRGNLKIRLGGFEDKEADASLDVKEMIKGLSEKLALLGAAGGGQVSGEAQ